MFEAGRFTAENPLVISLGQFAPKVDEFLVSQVMEKQVGDQDAAFAFGEIRDCVSLNPTELSGEARRARDEIHCGVAQPWPAGEAPGKTSTSRSKLDHVSRLAVPQFLFQPAMVARQRIDSLDVDPAPNRVRVIEGELVENFGS